MAIGSIDTSFVYGAGFSGVVLTAIETSDGGYLCGGSFFAYQGVSATKIIKLLPNGDIDPSFTGGTGFNFNVEDIIETSDGSYLIGGVFTLYDGNAVGKIVKLLPSGAIDTSFACTFDGTVYKLFENSGGDYLIGGAFSTHTKGAPLSALKIAKLATNGALDVSFDCEFDQEVRSIVEDTDGYVMGGAFTTHTHAATPTSLNRIAKVNKSDGSLVTSFTDNIGAGFTSVVQDIIITSDGGYLCGGNFTSYSGVTANRIIKLQTNGLIDTSFDYGTAFNSNVFALMEVYDEKYLVGGQFTTYQVTSANKIVRLLPNGDIDTVFDYGVGFNSTVRTLVDTSISGYLVGGNFINYQTIAARNLVRLLGENEPVTPTQPYCSLDTPYTTTDSTCGNSDGTILINNYENYILFYDFLIKDSFNNTISIDSTGLATVPAGYYFIEAIPITNTFRDTCTFDWIEIADSDSDIAVTGSTLSSAICGSFDQQEGRIIIEVSGATQPYSYYVWNAFGDLQTSGNTSNPLVIENLVGGTYYGLIDDGVCRFLFHITILEERIYSVPNIKEIYITEWNSEWDLNYWSTANDPDYYGGLDVLKFQSTKIAEYTDTGATWYYIPVDEQNVSFNQTLAKVRQGFIFTDTLTVAYSVYDQAQWDALSKVLANRYVVVFKDNNDQWWTFGYRHGAEATNYTFGSDDAGLRFTLTAISENKIITAIDESYVNTYIK